MNNVNNAQVLYHMGGFHLFERSSDETINDNRRIPRIDDELHPLQAIDLVSCDVYKSFTMPTEAKIQVRGKSDQLCKSFIRLQTPWFVLQCIAHAIRHLPVNHLEIVMLAYTAKNIVIYIFWWNKPLNVNQSIQVFPKSEPPLDMQPRAREPIPEAQKSTWEAIGKGLGTILTLIVKRMST